jgi:DNA helicase-2/ATP-dependent DNA helicase PcrA
MSQRADEIEVAGLEGDAEGQRIVREELRLLATITRAIETAAVAPVTKVVDDARMLELREEIACAKPEDLPSLFEQMHHIGALRAQRGKSVVGSLDRNAPYFGHLRLEEEGKRRDILIGSRSYVDPSAGIRIVDWRNAPVSSIYYRYSEGDDYEEALGDRIAEGVVRLKRSVAIKSGELVRVSAPQGTFTRTRDGFWKRIDTHSAKLITERKETRLGVGANGEIRQDKMLPEIASLLDPKQFDLIAKPSAGLVAIQGSAGSGKTTVGLHRVAYLGFTDPNRFAPNRMMVVVPNDALIHYVSRVLPSLGVPGVPVTTFGRFARRMVNLLFQKLPTALSDDTPPVVMRAKSHGRMLELIDHVVNRLTQETEGKLVDNMRKWEGGEVVVAAWRATSENPLDVRVSLLAGWLAGKRTIQGIRPASQLPEVTRGALERLGNELRTKSRGVTAVWDEILTSRERLNAAFKDEASFGPGRLEQVHDWCLKQARIRAEGDRDGEQPTLDSEDHALLLRIWQKLRGPLVDVDNTPIRIAHLFVDEVQDAGPIELRVMIDLTGKERCVTLAGDVAQRMLDEDDDTRGEFHWSELLESLGVSQMSIEPLQVSYRSTAEITDFARKVLGPLAHEAEPVAPRNGPNVELFGFTSVGEAVGFIADALKQLYFDEPDANVALIARFAQQADAYFDGLVRAEVPNLRRVAKQDFTWNPGVDVTDIRQTKGLEFDEVILLDTNASAFPVTDQARHALYGAATRASHQLWCVASEKPSDLVTNALG